MLDLAQAEDLRTTFVAQLLNSDEARVNHAHIVSLSDQPDLLHRRGLSPHLLGHWVRERGAVSLPEGVRRLHQSAALFGMPGRGLLREGYAADLLLFDPPSVGRGPKRRVFDLPGGAPP